MARDQNTEKVTIRLFRGDKDKLQSMFPGIGYNKVLRHLAHNLIKGVEEKAQRRSQSSTPQDVMINIDTMIEEAKHDE